MRCFHQLSQHYRRAIFAAVLLAQGMTPTFAHAYQFYRVGTIDNSTATANQLCYWSGTALECSATNPTIVSGQVGIGSTSPVASLDISQKTDAVSLPVGTTGTRPTGVNGMIRYNTGLTPPALEAFVNGGWESLQTSGTTSGVLGVANGGTGDNTLTAHGVIVGEGTSPAAVTAAGAIDTVLVGNGASADPTFTGAPTLSGTLTDLQSIGATSTDGMVLQNTTAAALGAQQWSPRVHFSGQGWQTGTSASQAVDMIEELQPVQGTTNPSGNLVWSKSVNGGAYGALMTLTSGGYVGIGTASPIAPLEVRAASNEDLYIAGRVNLSTGVSLVSVNDAVNGQQGMELDGSNFLLNASGTKSLSVTSTGNVGIGTASPGSLLTTYEAAAKTATYTGVLHTVSDTSSTASVNKVGMDIESTGTWNGTSAVNTGLVVNATGGTTNYAATFSGGNVGIGTTNPAAMLDVYTSAGVGAIDLGGVNGISYPASSTTPGASIAIGSGALANQPSSAAYGNTAVGYQTLNSASMTTAAVEQTAIGYQAGKSITSASTGTFVGWQAGVNVTSGPHNTAVGVQSLTQLTTANYSAALGYQALDLATGSSGTAVGGRAGVYIGSGAQNTAIGASAMLGVSGNLITGAGNTAVGYQALTALITTGATNTALGSNAGATITTGSSNVVIGPSVASTTLQTGSNNILIGTNAGVDAASASTSNSLNIGNLIYGTGLATSGTTPTGNVGIGTTSPGSSLQVNGGAAVGYSTSTAAPTNGLAVSGNVAVGTTSVPSGVAESINGPVQVAGTGSEVCDNAHIGAMRYNSTLGYMQICQ